MRTVFQRLRFQPQKLHWKSSNGLINIPVRVFSLGAVAAVGGVALSAILLQPIAIADSEKKEGLADKVAGTVGSAVGSIQDIINHSNDPLIPPLDLKPYTNNRGEVEEANLPITVVLGFDRTLVYGMYTREHGYRWRKRPNVDNFLRDVRMQDFELVIWNSQNQAEHQERGQYELDKHGCVQYHLWNQASFHGGYWVRDLSRLGRPLNRVIVVDSEPDNVLQQENVLRISEFTDNKKDKELVVITEFLKWLRKANPSDVRELIKKFNENPHQDWKYVAKPKLPPPNDVCAYITKFTDYLREKAPSQLH